MILFHDAGVCACACRSEAERQCCKSCSPDAINTPSIPAVELEFSAPRDDTSCDVEPSSSLLYHGNRVVERPLEKILDKGAVASLFSADF
jgi:hypothetical protein